jgi:hypothetical protein
MGKTCLNRYLHKHHALQILQTQHPHAHVHANKHAVILILPVRQGQRARVLHSVEGIAFCAPLISSKIYMHLLSTNEGYHRLFVCACVVCTCAWKYRILVMIQTEEVTDARQLIADYWKRRPTCFGCVGQASVSCSGIFYFNIVLLQQLLFVIADSHKSTTRSFVSRVLRHPSSLAKAP